MYERSMCECLCPLWEEWSLTQETWPGLSGNLRVTQSHHKTTSLSDPTSLPPSHPLSLSLTHYQVTHTFLFYER